MKVIEAAETRTTSSTRSQTMARMLLSPMHLSQCLVACFACQVYLLNVSVPDESLSAASRRAKRSSCSYPDARTGPDAVIAPPLSPLVLAHYIRESRDCEGC